MRMENVRGHSGWRRRIAVVGAAIIVWATVICVNSPLHAGSGDLDPTFGSDGRVTTDFDGRTDYGFGLVLQPDGKVVVVGFAVIDDEGELALARYTEGGELDETFGDDGKVTTDFGTGSDDAMAVALQPDGKLVVAGRMAAPDFVLARYTADGELDTTFGTGGKVTTDFSGGADEALAVATQPDGKIVAVGRAEINGSVDFALARYTVSGDLDDAFGVGGKVSTDFGGDHDPAQSVAIQQDGKIVVAGGSVADFDSDFAVARYSAAGDLDGTFGTGGKVTTDFEGDYGEVAYGVVLQRNGKVLIAGDRNGWFALARYTIDGELDAAFGTSGTITTKIVGRHAEVALQPDGKIVVAGVSDDNDFVLMRFTAAGEFDETFGTNGMVTTDFDDGLDEAFGVAVQPDGKIVAAGTALVDFHDDDFAVARYSADSVSPEGLGAC